MLPVARQVGGQSVCCPLLSGHTPLSHSTFAMLCADRSHACAGVVGVTATGYLLHAASGKAGWWAAFALSSALCLLGSFFFASHAQGKHIFGDQV